MSAVWCMLWSMPSDEPLERNVDRRGTSIDEAVAFYEAVHQSQDIHIGRPGDDGFSWRYRLTGDHDVAIGTSSVGADRWGTVGQSSSYVLAWTTGPGFVLDAGGRDPVPMLPGVPVMYPSGRDFRFAGHPTTQHLIRFDAAFLESVAAARRGSVPAPLVFGAAEPAQIDRLRAVVAGAAPELLDPALDRHRRAALGMLVAEAVLDAFSPDPVPEVVLHAGPATMRYAQEWMVANAHRAITSTDVSRATGIAARSLQSTFQRHTGTTPMGFLRDVRLHRAHARLVDGDPASTTVAVVARDCGFAHLGRFAGYYADTFGERPSDTLRRSAAGPDRP